MCIRDSTLRKLVEWKKLPVLKVGRKVLIKTDILEKFMEANEAVSYTHLDVYKRQTYSYVDEEMRNRLQVRLITRTLM